MPGSIARFDELVRQRAKAEGRTLPPPERPRKRYFKPRLLREEEDGQLTSEAPLPPKPQETVTLTHDELKEVVRKAKEIALCSGFSVKIETIQRVVAARYSVTVGDILSSRRTANVVLPRQIAMYLAKEITLKSLPEIGRRFGGRDHTTVLHAVRKIAGIGSTRPEVAEEVEELKALLKGAAS